MDHQKELIPSTEGFFVIAHRLGEDFCGGTERGVQYLQDNVSIAKGFVEGKISGILMWSPT